jgi:hypothetical protein
MNNLHRTVKERAMPIPAGWTCDICHKPVTKALMNIARALYAVNGQYHPACYEPIHRRRYGAFKGNGPRAVRAF